MAVFDWAESPGSTSERRPRVVATQFGDGYQQRAADGLNPVQQLWDLVFADCEASKADQIETFLLDGLGWKAFTWTPPRQTVALRWICTSLRRSIGERIDTHTITARFEQVFEA